MQNAWYRVAENTFDQRDTAGYGLCPDRPAARKNQKKSQVSLDLVSARIWSRRRSWARKRVPRRAWIRPFLITFWSKKIWGAITALRPIIAPCINTQYDQNLDDCIVNDQTTVCATILYIYVGRNNCAPKLLRPILRPTRKLLFLLSLLLFGVQRVQ